MAIVETVGMAKMITWWQLILDEIVLVVVLIAGIGFFNRRSMIDVQRLIAAEVKEYLGVTLEDHRNKAAEIVAQGVQVQLDRVTEELRIALAEVVRAEAAQLVAEDAQDVAEVATQAKTDFLSRMSHEIRTPINGIVGSLALIKPNQLTAVQAEDLSRAVISADRLMVVVNDVLDLAKIEADEIEYLSHPFNLKNMCHEAVDSFRPLAAEKGLVLSCWISEKVVLERLGDEQKIHQILTNLISNAVKFTDRGTIRLAVNSGYENSIKFSVEDSGIGISKQDQATIFDSFSVISQNTSGTGLGLSICKTFVQGMGGEITVASQVATGTSFTFELPLPLANDKVTDSDSDSDSDSRYNLNVLSADDDEINRRVLQRHLESLGCVVLSVDNGQDALTAFKDTYEFAQAPPFDLVLMDLLMPVMDGFEATAEIRRLEKKYDRKPVPIIAITASVVGKIEAECKASGMDGFLSKPFRTEDLKRIIKDTSQWEAGSRR